MPKNDITRSRGKYPGEAGATWEFGATAKPEADEHHGRQRDTGLAGHDKQQGDLQDQDRGTYSQQKKDGSAGERTPHQDAQHGADVRGQAPMLQRNEGLPEGLARERKGPLDKNVGRNEAATQVPKNWNPKEGEEPPK